jgi:Fe-S oxidoreductase
MTKPESTSPQLLFDERLKSLTLEDRRRILAAFKKNITGEYALFLQTCARCGLCAESCHYYLSSKDPRAIPAHKLGHITKVFKKNFDPIGRKLSSLVGAEALTNEVIEEWVDTLFGLCTLCGRCALNCTMGINIPYLIRAARGALAAAGIVPPGLQSTVDTALRKGNNMGISKEDWLETVEWLEEELQQEVEDRSARLPVDKQGARVMYTINPREAMFFPLSITAAAKIFYAASEDWTFSSENFDVTNYGLYNGDDEAAGLMSGRLIQSMERLGCRELVLAECGHGFNSNRWEAPEWLSRPTGFPVKSILQLIAGYIREGRLNLDPGRNHRPVTLHDPCNLVRLGGIVEEQRYIIRHSVLNFVEMTPNREKNFCCGGGGGQLAMTRFSKNRLKAGGIKADQIRATGAEIVVTPCHNCIDQLMELNKHYQLGIEIKTVSEMVANAIVTSGMPS